MDREPRTRALADNRPRTVDLLSTLPGLSWHWMVLLGPRCKIQRQGLLWQFAVAEIEGHGPGTPDHG
ncbi:MAG: hypothetical protein ACI90E_002159, partial [Yoonia sp.]